VKVKCYILK